MISMDWLDWRRDREGKLNKQRSGSTIDTPSPCRDWPYHTLADRDIERSDMILTCIIIYVFLISSAVI
jgi:hypothetical protein